MAKSSNVIRNYSHSRLCAISGEIAAGTAASDARAIDIIKTGYWFERLRSKIRKTTAYAVGKAIRPEQYRASSEERNANSDNLWAKYATGAMRPGPATIKAADRIVPGSSIDLYLPLWTALNVKVPLVGGIENHLRAAIPLVQNAVFEPRELRLGRYRRRPSLLKTLSLLECHVCMDSIAALVLILRSASEAGEFEDCFRIGKSLYTSLLIACIRSDTMFLAPEFALYFGERIFPLASTPTVAFDISPEEFRTQVILLWQLYLALEDEGRFPPMEIKSTRSQQRIVNGDFSDLHRLALSPRLKPIGDPESIGRKVRRTLAVANGRRDRALCAYFPHLARTQQ
ncbi:hypothetical protein C7S18_17740 [Ahniella affigens]|uniref:Uncharacterized protein n=1 Tax=Ahniella affigens TaxID=2021234 RepID=A0A2P1PVM4_9GAMM|nr:hypothetical protein [Ahniella affigens]AVP98907.1 hypothetical protein C7S18_17740 [Ahniella affigens]